MARGGAFKSVAAAMQALRRDTKKLVRGMDGAAHRAALKVAAQVRRDIPVAFGELRDSVHVEGTKLVIDAPYAAAVELGSRPHWMPLEPLISWVKLRGFQSLVGTKSQSRLPGSTTVEHARNIGMALETHRRGGEIGVATQSTSLDAPVAIAKAIQLRIAMAGTKPHWFVRNNLPFARLFLSEEVALLIRGG